jgi:hypothetical protein
MWRGSWLGDVGPGCPQQQEQHAWCVCCPCVMLSNTCVAPAIYSLYNHQTSTVIAMVWHYCGGPNLHAAMLYQQLWPGGQRVSTLPSGSIYMSTRGSLHRGWWQLACGSLVCCPAAYVSYMCWLQPCVHMTSACCLAANPLSPSPTHPGHPGLLIGAFGPVVFPYD